MSQNNNNNSANIAYITIIDVSLIWDNDTNNLTNSCKINYYGYKQLTINFHYRGNMDTNVVGYYRTSSSSNVGNDKDSRKRQKHSVETYTKWQNHHLTTTPPKPLYWKGLNVKTKFSLSWFVNIKVLQKVPH